LLFRVIGSGLFAPERELINDVVDEVDHALCMLVADFKCSGARSDVNGGILEAADLLGTVAMNVRNLLVVAFGEELTHKRTARQSAHVATAHNACDTSIRVLKL